MKTGKLNGLELAGTPVGFSVIDCPMLTLALSTAIASQISDRLGQRFQSLQSTMGEISGRRFSDFKEKRNRLLPQNSVEIISNLLRDTGLLSDVRGDFITDEERNGYPNIYWRIVRSNSATDVGSVHADKWFWDLGHGSIPQTHERVKIWLPLVQEDAEPGLKILPGSQLRDYEYTFVEDSMKKKRPLFTDQTTIKHLKPAPVRVSQAIIFNDRLLHVGCTTSFPRVSAEFTIACGR